MVMTKGGVLITPKLKNLDVKRRLISGYYTAFGNLDADEDIGTPGMTLKSIAETGPKSNQPRIKHFKNHNIYEPLGLLQDMGEDDFGAWYESLVGTHDLGTDFLKMADSGLITEHSYQLSVLERDKADKRRMKQVKVWEVSSLTAWGANQNTPFISLGKSMSVPDQIQYWENRSAAIEKFCRNTDATDETIQSLLIEQKALTQQIHELLISTTRTAGEASGAPGKQLNSGLLAGILADINTINF